MYNASIVQMITDNRCFICGRTDGKLDRHEIFHGEAYREKSKEYGLWVTLCHTCHMHLHQLDKKSDKRLKRLGQKRAMERYRWTTADFISHFGKNYLEEENNA